MSLIAVLIAPMIMAPVQEPKPVEFPPVKLTRTFKAGESQAYKASFTLKTEAMQGELKTEGEFVLSIKDLVETGAKVESEIKSLKMSFGGQDSPPDEMPKPMTIQFSANGLPKDLDGDEMDENPLSFLFPSFYVPAIEVGVGKTFEVKWTSANGKTSLKGEGKLIATGMLYEEHVSKVSMTVNVEPKDDTPAKYEYTAYFNTDNGKLVKADGKITADDADLGGKFTADFVVAKVRSKALADFSPDRQAR